jgi:hypothetical protein
MSAVLTRRRRSGPGRERDRHQPSLFSQVVAPPSRPDQTRAAAVVAPAPVREPDVVEVAPDRVLTDAPDAGSVLATRTLDDAISALWGQLVTGEAADCPVCGSAMAPRHSAGSGVVGGRCGTCATTLA